MRTELVEMILERDTFDCFLAHQGGCASCVRQAEELADAIADWATHHPIPGRDPGPVDDDTYIAASLIEIFGARDDSVARWARMITATRHSDTVQERDELANLVAEMWDGFTGASEPGWAALARDEVEAAIARRDERRSRT